MTLIASDGSPTVRLSRTGIFRRMPRNPVLNQPSEQGDCDKASGHVLVLRSGQIVCRACDATWKDEGF